MQTVSLLGIPVYTLAKFRGMGLAVKALRELGIADALRESSRSFTDYGDVRLLEIRSDTGPSNLRNFSLFSESTDMIYEAASRILPSDSVFCLGGECGLVVGSLASLKHTMKGKPGMLWMDAHGDFNTPETSSSGFIGGMPLALACGRGPRLSPKIESMRPILNEEGLVHLGDRDLDPLESEAMEDSPMRRYPASMIRRGRVEKIADEVASYLAESADWLICHLDVDVVDPSIVPAVDFPAENGLTLEEVKTIIRTLKATGKLKVFNLTAYDATLDDSHTSGSTIVRMVSEIFS